MGLKGHRVLGHRYQLRGHTNGTGESTLHFPKTMDLVDPSFGNTIPRPVAKLVRNRRNHEIGRIRCSNTSPA
jgi:hypothetical protein